MLDPKPSTLDIQSKAADLHSLLRCALVAEDNETSGIDWKGLERVLGMAERMADELMNDIDVMATKGGDD
ncbi:MAG: hypothetical protein ACQEVT_01075 [Pseudomonadota bacterium]